MMKLVDKLVTLTTPWTLIERIVGVPKSTIHRQYKRCRDGGSVGQSDVMDVAFALGLDQRLVNAKGVVDIWRLLLM